MFTKRNWKTKLSTKKVYNLIRKIKGIRLIEQLFKPSFMNFYICPDLKIFHYLSISVPEMRLLF